ncbi:MAG: hypothetical protein ABI857_09675 [Acidobacteriota bacterium]
MTTATGKIEKERRDDGSKKNPCLRLVSTVSNGSSNGGFRIGIADDVFALGDRIRETSGSTSQGRLEEPVGDGSETRTVDWKELRGLETVLTVAAAGLALGYFVGRRLRS